MSVQTVAYLNCASSVCSILVSAGFELMATELA
jgi:hypothetical protein